MLTLSLEDILLRVLSATLSVSEAICRTMVLLGTLPSCSELSLSAADLLVFFFPFFLPTFFGMVNEDTLEVPHVSISIETSAYYKEDLEAPRNTLSAILFISLSCSLLDPVLLRTLTHA